MKKLKKGKAQLYLEPGLPRKIRLSKEYPPWNIISLNKGGTHCVLCCNILGNKIRKSTTKGCETCQVPLCSSSSNIFVNANESCEYRWHNISDLRTLSKPEKRSLEKNLTGIIVDAANGLLNLNRNNTDNVRILRRRRRQLLLN